MSVLKNDRVIAPYEYERTFGLLYQFSMKNTSKASKRRKRWICDEIDGRMNALFNTITGLSTNYFEPSNRKASIAEIIKEAIEGLCQLQKPLLAFWNISESKISTMEQWVKYINKDLKLLNNMLEEKVDYDPLFIIDYDSVSKAEYVKKMAELHKYVHGKIVHAPLKYQNTGSNLIISLIDDALYNVMSANVRIPKTAEQYKKRRKKISKAISDLNKLQRPLSVYFVMLEYSEKEIAKLSSLIREELKLLYGINRSDKDRFSNLK